MTNISFTSHTLDNGLTVLLQENHSAPIISHQVWYRVGSRNEIPGKTGISHFVEHMQFKGTKKFPGLKAVREIVRNGGTVNAATCQDWTAYQETMPAERIGLALEMDADRMENTLFAPEDVESERTVILSEKAGDESDRTNCSLSSILKAAFLNHPYRNPIIGETEDLYGLTRDDLYDHYRTWYVPNNAVIAAAGDFSTDKMLRQIETAYGHIPARSIPAVNIVPDEPIRSPLRIGEYDPDGFIDLSIMWRAPAAKDPAFFALMLLENILVGPVSMDIGDYGRIRINLTSRLYRRLTAGKIAADISGSFAFTTDPYVVSNNALVIPGISPEEASEAIFTELESISRKGVLPGELEKARKQAKAGFAVSTENSANQAFWLGHSSMFAEPGWYSGYTEQLENVNAEDISRIAGSLFRRDNCITGLFNAKEYN